MYTITARKGLERKLRAYLILLLCTHTICAASSCFNSRQYFRSSNHMQTNKICKKKTLEENIYSKTIMSKIIEKKIEAKMNDLTEKVGLGRV